MEKSTNNIVVSKFFARTPSSIRWIVKIWDVVDQFLRKPFWFFLMWHDGGYSFSGYGFGMRGFLCLFWRKTHTNGLSVRFPMIPEEVEERQGPRANREELATVRERRLLGRGGCWMRSWDQWTQEPGQPTREDETAFLVAVWHSQEHRMSEKCPNFFLTLRANPSPCLFYLLSSTLGYNVISFIYL